MTFFSHNLLFAFQYRFSHFSTVFNILGRIVWIFLQFIFEFSPVAALFNSFVENLLLCKKLIFKLSVSILNRMHNFFNKITFFNELFRHYNCYCYQRVFTRMFIGLHSSTLPCLPLKI